MSEHLVGKYKLGKVLGAGDFDSRIRLSTHIFTGVTYAVKIYDKNILAECQWMWNQVREAVQVMRTLPKHENLIEMVECFETAASLYIQMQLHCPVQITQIYNAESVAAAYSDSNKSDGGTLTQKPSVADIYRSSGNTRSGEIKKTQILASAIASKPDAELTRGYFHQAVKGILHLHNHGVVHLRLAPDHIMVNNEHQLKIGFLESCCFHHNSTDKINELRGTTHTVAPEALSGEPYNPRLADAWSLGVLLYFMCAGGRYPHDSANTSKHIISHNIRPLPNDIDPDARNLIYALLMYNPEHRLSVTQITQHPYFSVSAPCPSVLLPTHIILIGGIMSVNDDNSDDNSDEGAPSSAGAYYYFSSPTNLITEDVVDIPVPTIIKSEGKDFSNSITSINGSKDALDPEEEDKRFARMRMKIAALTGERRGSDLMSGKRRTTIFDNDTENKNGEILLNQNEESKYMAEGIDRSDDVSNFDSNNRYEQTPVEIVNDILASIAAEAEKKGKLYIEANKRNISRRKSILTGESYNWSQAYLNPYPPEASEKATGGRLQRYSNDAKTLMSERNRSPTTLSGIPTRQTKYTPRPSIRSSFSLVNNNGRPFSTSGVNNRRKTSLGSLRSFFPVYRHSSASSVNCKRQSLIKSDTNQKKDMASYSVSNIQQDVKVESYWDPGDGFCIVLPRNLPRYQEAAYLIQHTFWIYLQKVDPHWDLMIPKNTPVSKLLKIYRKKSVGDENESNSSERSNSRGFSSKLRRKVSCSEASDCMFLPFQYETAHNGDGRLASPNSDQYRYEKSNKNVRHASNMENEKFINITPASTNLPAPQSSLKQSVNADIVPFIRYSYLSSIGSSTGALCRQCGCRQKTKISHNSNAVVTSGNRPYPSASYEYSSKYSKFTSKQTDFEISRTKTLYPWNSNPI